MFSKLGRRVLTTGAHLTERYPAKSQPLAVPPPGSDLEPVPGDPGAPGIGISLSALADPLGSGRRAHAKYGPVSWSTLLGRRVVVAQGPDAAEAVLMDRNKSYSAEKGWEFLIGPFFRGGILMKDFDEHKFHRRIMQQAFTRPQLIGYMELTTPEIARVMDGWRTGDDFAAARQFKRLLLNLSTRAFVGVEPGTDMRRIEEAFEAAVTGGQAIIRASVPGGTWSNGLQGRRVVADYFRQLLPSKHASDGNDLFSVLCRTSNAEGNALSDKQIVDHMIFVLLAAHDTSTIALSMMTYLLAKHPEWQERVRAESVALGKDTLDYDDLDKLTSLDLVFKETLRMYAPVGQQLRETVQDTDLLGYYVPAGTPVIVTPYVTQRTDTWWSEADQFDPERFSPERQEDKSHRFAWAPFGGGVHKCIGLYFGGMTVKATMHQMLLRYRWSVPDDYEVELGWATGPIPVDGLPIRLERLEPVRHAVEPKRSA